METLSAKRTVTLAGSKDDEQETCFSCSLAPSELYMELIHSYCATCVVDASPAQGDLLKAALSSRTKAVAICGTESHSARLELLLTDYVLAELSREGSTFYRPDSVSKDTKEEDVAEVPTKETKKRPKKTADDDAGEAPPKKPRQSKLPAAAEEDEGDAPEPKKKNKKPKKNNKDKQEADECDEESSELWDNN